jgi:hypothetical protein
MYYFCNDLNKKVKIFQNMKKFAFLAFFVAFAFAGINAQATKKAEKPVEVAKKAVLTFENGQNATDADYGTVAYGSDRVRKVKFTNTGNAPLVIASAHGSCGCTVPTWPKEEIAPGASSTIDINYDTNRPGAINKTVTIKLADGTEHFVRVLGTVKDKTMEISVPVGDQGLIKSGGGN